MSEFYKPVRDDFFAAYFKTRVPTKAGKAEASSPLYVLGGVMKDVQDIVASLYSYGSQEQTEAVMKDWLKGFKPPATQFAIEFPGTEVDSYFSLSVSDRTAAMHAVGIGADQEWLYAMTLITRIGQKLWHPSSVLIVGPDVIDIRPFDKGFAGNVGGKLQEFARTSIVDVDVQQIFCSCFSTLIAFTRLLTAKNVAVSSVSYTSKQMRRYTRSTDGRMPPLYRILTINRPTFINAAMLDSEEGDDMLDDLKIKRKRHHVRGHFRTYRSDRYRPEVRGTYWISPHWRGDAAVGVIDSPVVVKIHKPDAA